MNEMWLFFLCRVTIRKRIVTCRLWRSTVASGRSFSHPQGKTRLRASTGYTVWHRLVSTFQRLLLPSNFSLFTDSDSWGMTVVWTQDQHEMHRWWDSAGTVDCNYLTVRSFQRHGSPFTPILSTSSRFPQVSVLRIRSGTDRLVGYVFFPPGNHAIAIDMS